MLSVFLEHCIHTEGHGFDFVGKSLFKVNSSLVLRALEVCTVAALSKESALLEIIFYEDESWASAIRRQSFLR